jgi:hypothetical protein
VKAVEVQQSLALTSMKKLPNGRAPAELPTRSRFRIAALKVDIDEDTAVPMDLYMSLLEAAEKAKSGQHVLRDVSTGCKESDSQAASRSSKNQQRLVRND